MPEPYRICYQGGQGEITEKKSRFIAAVRPVKTEAEAAAFIEEIRKTYWDARHNCYAYICKNGQDGHPQMKCSDDGEPSQTAGRPMLDVLLGEGIWDVCVVVTRYFGGTLLGTGGLVRAYSQAVKEGLKNSRILEKLPGRKLTFTVDYTAVGKLQYLAGKMGLVTLDCVYTDKVEMVLLAPEGQEEEVLKKVAEATGGTANAQCSDPIFYALDGKETILF
ncbi:MAG: YigZ family protein [Lachnospiraceae bacterium]|nr:YigZ family protein [Lachnospiraceae bacterium]